MKKLLAVVLVLCLLVPCAFAEAPVDVKSMSDAELKSLYISVKEELMERKLWDTSILPAGIYIGGVTLPEGYYELTLNDSDIVAAWKSYEDYKQDTINNVNNVVFYQYLKKGTKITMSLVDGMVWRIPCDCVVRPFTGLDW